MNLLLLEPEEVSSNQAQIGGERARHVREVLKTPIGGEIRAGVVEGALGRARIVAMEGETITLELTLDEPPPQRPLTDLILAVPRPKTLAKVLPEIAAFGVDRLVLIRSWKVEKPYLESELLTPAGHGPLLRAGAMQARTTRLPVVTIAPLFRPWIEDVAPAMFADHAVRWVLDAAAARSTASFGPIGERVVLAIGPEGGWLPFEIERFEAAGFTAVSMGSRPLRSETATVAALAQIDLLRAFARDVHERALGG